MSGITIGIAFGLVASFGWALANVYIQRSARAMGSLRSMFWGQLVGARRAVPDSFVIYLLFALPARFYSLPCLSPLPVRAPFRRSR